MNDDDNMQSSNATWKKNKNKTNIQDKIKNINWNNRLIKRIRSNITSGNLGQSNILHARLNNLNAHTCLFQDIKVY